MSPLQQPPPTQKHQPIDPLQQAGGGASETARTLKTVNPVILKHLTRIFQAHADADSHLWTNAQIRAFAADVQRQAPSAALDDLLAKESLDTNGFLAWMASSLAAATTPPREQDLSWPLSSYFVSSSHNTYLTGNQLYSNSSTKPYRDTLLRGGRCIEVDVWDGDESDAEGTSSSSLSTSDEEAGRVLKKRTSATTKKKSTFGMLKDSVTSKLEKTSIGGGGGDSKPKSKPPSPSKSPSKSPVTVLTTETEPDAVAVVEPRVLHGYTLTKEITFRAVCVSIREAAFVVSDLPVIVSLEVHCNPEQQMAMVRIMKEVFAGMLVPEPKADTDVLPCPADLRRKLLIKVKYAPPPGAAPVPEDSEEEERAASSAAATTTKQKQKPAAKPAKIIQELSRMGIYTRGVSFKSLSQPEAEMPTHVFSLSEKKVVDVHEKQAAQLFNHNKYFMMRTYPWGLRIGSSNLDPAVFWRKGIQVVALNWQKWDEGMMLNEGMFAGTGGYVLKPEGYRPDLQGKEDIPNKISRKTLNLLSITFLAAQNIPLPPGDKSAKGFRPYVKVELHVEGPDEYHGGPIPNDGHEREGEYKARTRTHKGRDVDFASEALEFRHVPHIVDELSWVRFTVRDDEIGRDDLAAWACVRLDRLGQGYRFVHLLDCEGRVTDGAVLVKIEKRLK